MTKLGWHRQTWALGVRNVLHPPQRLCISTHKKRKKKYDLLLKPPEKLLKNKYFLKKTFWWKSSCQCPPFLILSALSQLEFKVSCDQISLDKRSRIWKRFFFFLHSFLNIFCLSLELQFLMHFIYLWTSVFANSLLRFVRAASWNTIHATVS